MGFGSLGVISSIILTNLTLSLFVYLLSLKSLAFGLFCMLYRSCRRARMDLLQIQIDKEEWRDYSYS